MKYSANLFKYNVINSEDTAVNFVSFGPLHLPQFTIITVLLQFLCFLEEGHQMYTERGPSRCRFCIEFMVTTSLALSHI